MPTQKKGNRPYYSCLFPKKLSIVKEKKGNIMWGYKKIILILILFLCKESTTGNKNNNITVIGTGYVGLVVGVSLAELGWPVTCADINSKKINSLQKAIIPIYEPGLQSLVDKNLKNNQICFTNNVSEAIQKSNIIFVTVDTPMGKNGKTDLTNLKKCFKTIAMALNNYKVIVLKSTIPIGTAKKLSALLTKQYGIDPQKFDLITNPEFLCEGNAIENFFNPDRIVIGSQSKKASEIIQNVYQILLQNSTPLIETDITSAEVIKHASNAFLANKITFINEIANLCDSVGADCKKVATALGLDRRIGQHFLNPGPGFGGSCFHKDIISLLNTAKKQNVSLKVIGEIIESNNLQNCQAFKKLCKLMNNQIDSKTVAILGLSFKANTDDIRNSPAIPIIDLLLKHNTHIKAYDPAAMENMRSLYPNLCYCNSAYEAITNADAIIILTEWDEFKRIDPQHAYSLTKDVFIVDMRNILNLSRFIQYGFSCDNIGQSYLCKNNTTIP